MLRAVFDRSTVVMNDAGSTLRPDRTHIVKKSDGVRYIDDLLAVIDLPHVRMLHVITASEPCFYIRHDVDRDLDTALAIARVEAAHGYAATYFLLTPGSYGEPANYYGSIENGVIRHHPDLVDRCKALLDLGHDLGFHNDLVALSLRTARSPHELLAREVEFFSRHEIELTGVAAHGSPLARELQFNNRELFTGCVRRGWTVGRSITRQSRRVALHSLRLADYGFQYEAYSLPRDSRLSESGSHWAGRIAGNRVPRERWAVAFDRAEFRSLLARVSALHGVRAMSLLTHPCHWRTA